MQTPVSSHKSRCRHPTMPRSTNTCTTLIAHEEDLPTAFKPVIDATKEVLGQKCGRCGSGDATEFYITCMAGCASCNKCPEVYGTEDFFYKQREGVNICTCRTCSEMTLPMPVPNLSYKNAKTALENVQTEVMHGVSLMKEHGYVTKGMENGEAPPDWVPIPPKQAFSKAKASIASKVRKMKRKGRSAEEIEAYICGDAPRREDSEAETEEPEETPTKKMRKEPTADQLARREEKKEERRLKKEEDKKRLVEYPHLKEENQKFKNMIKEARVALLAHLPNDDIEGLFGEDSDSEDESEAGGTGGIDSDDD